MKFYIITHRSSKRLNVTVEGDTVYLNDETLDFSELGEGDWISTRDIGSEWVGPGGAERKNGEIVLTLIVPHGMNAPEELINPPAWVRWGEDWTQIPPYGESLGDSQEIDRTLPDGQ